MTPSSVVVVVVAMRALSFFWHPTAMGPCVGITAKIENR
jgi:hypothetical protein